MQFSPEVLIVVGPLIAAAFAGLLQRYIGDKVAMTLTTASVGLSLVLSWPIFIDFVWGEGHERIVPLQWPRLQTPLRPPNQAVLEPRAGSLIRSEGSAG